VQKLITFAVLAGIAVYCFVWSVQYQRRTGSLWKPILNHDSHHIRFRHGLLPDWRNPGLSLMCLSIVSALLSLTVLDYDEKVFEIAFFVVFGLILFPFLWMRPQQGLPDEKPAARWKQRQHNTRSDHH